MAGSARRPRDGEGLGTCRSHVGTLCSRAQLFVGPTAIAGDRLSRQGRPRLPENAGIDWPHGGARIAHGAQGRAFRAV
eukprot:11885506-Alexandrium_andersonii.AAC.1